VAITATGEALTALHRDGQKLLGRSAMADMANLWGLLDPRDLDATATRWLRAVSLRIMAQHEASSALSARYLQAFRLAELGSPGTPILAAPLPTAQLTTALQVTGPGTIKRLTAQGRNLETASNTALSRVMGTSSRLTLAGGRSTVSRTIAADSKALGWQRVASASACAFCALLAGRGAVYKTEASAAGTGYHDHCSCYPEPVYDKASKPPPNTERYADLYQENRGRTTADTLRNMRAALSEGDA
jgi:hypothetical protein